MTRTPIDAVSTGGMITASTTNALIGNDGDHESRIVALGTGVNRPLVGVNALTGYFYADAYPGIDPSGRTDSTAGMNALHAALPAGATVFYRPGRYVVSGPLTQPSFQVTVMGVGDGTVWLFQPSAAGVMMTIRGSSYVKFVALKFLFTQSAAAAGSTFFLLSNTFCCKFHRCTFQGQHTAVGDAYGTATGHIGVALSANAGDSVFMDCLWSNLGVGVATDSIQNAIIGGRFATCWIGIHGTSNIAGSGQANSGMTISGYVPFISSAAMPGLVHRNILIDGAAGQWWISQMWAEGGDIAIEVGSGAGGPSQFVLTSSKISAQTRCIVLHNANWPKLSGVQVGKGTVGLSIDAGLRHGVADALTSNIADDPQVVSQVYLPATFPKGWVLNGTPV